jgi:glycosyltransferase involved in cell wall biosynthesis
LHEILEPLVYRRARHIVVASQGLARELRDFYPGTADRINVIPNPVDLDRMQRPSDFDPSIIRTRLGVPQGHTLLAFIALGQFERKGLPLLLEAMRLHDTTSLSLVVVGGEDDLVTAWRARVAQLGLADRVHFEGMRHDVRPYLWAADAFVLPSAYEVFPLVALEAAGSGLPVIATPLNGVEEFLRDGENGLLIQRTSNGICEGLHRFLALSKDGRRRLGEQAQRDVQVYGTEQFVAEWRAFYAALRARRASARP